MLNQVSMVFLKLAEDSLSQIVSMLHMGANNTFRVRL